MLQAIPFALGSFLPDYNEAKFDIAPGLRFAAEVLGWCFIILFIISNMQAVIVSHCVWNYRNDHSNIMAIGVILLGYITVIFY